MYQIQQILNLPMITEIDALNFNSMIYCIRKPIPSEDVPEKASL